MVRLLCASCLFMLACSASASTQVSANSQGDVVADANGSLDTRGTPSGVAANAPPPRTSMFDEDEPTTPNAAAASRPLLGARAGLHLDKAEPVVCHCLAVLSTKPSDPRLRWEGRVSEIDETTQTVVALSSEGVDCPDAPAGSLGASYHGYQAEGSDVVILVEAGRGGRPLASGAIVPLPAAGGRLLIRPVDRNTPYGRSLDNRDQNCVVMTAR